MDWLKADVRRCKSLEQPLFTATKFQWCRNYKTTNQAPHGALRAATGLGLVAVCGTATQSQNQHFLCCILNVPNRCFELIEIYKLNEYGTYTHQNSWFAPSLEQICWGKKTWTMDMSRDWVLDFMWILEASIYVSVDQQMCGCPCQNISVTMDGLIEGRSLLFCVLWRGVLYFLLSC